MASLYHFHGIPKHLTARKEFGVFAHPVLQPCNILTQAFPPVVGIPGKPPRSQACAPLLAKFNVLARAGVG